MKIKPQKFAEMLVKSAKPGNLEMIAESLWYSLQKNKQYKDLPKILELIDIEYAKQNGSTLAKVYSEKSLTNDEQTEIKAKLEKKLSGQIMIKNIISNQSGGITVKIDDRIIDLSTIGKIDKLKMKLTNIN